MLYDVAVLRPSGKSKIKLSLHMMLIPIDSFIELSLSPQCLLQRQTTVVFLVPSLPLVPGVTQLAQQRCCLTSLPSEGCFSTARVSRARAGCGYLISRVAAVHKAVFQ